jgi:hypothetical protein
MPQSWGLECYEGGLVAWKMRKVERDRSEDGLYVLLVLRI